MITRDDQKTSFLLDYPDFKELFKLIGIDLGKQLDSHPKAMQQINVNGNVDKTGNKTLNFILEEVK